jgi:hypothetical protein
MACAMPRSDGHHCCVCCASFTDLGGSVMGGVNGMLAEMDRECYGVSPSSDRAVRRVRL